MTRPGLEVHLGAVRQRFAGSPERCRVLLLGEDNPISTAPEFALYCAPNGCAGQRLQDVVLGIPRADYLGIWRTNLCTDGWKAGAARDRAAQLIRGAHPWEVIIALGVKVTEAVWRASGDSERWAPFETRRVFTLIDHENASERRVITLPHPSGRNAATWSKPGAIDRARDLVRAAAPELWP